MRPVDANYAEGHCHRQACREWTRSHKEVDPDDFDGADGLRELNLRCRELAAAGSPEDLETLRNLLRKRANRTFERHDVPRIVAAAFISRGLLVLRSFAD
jgi:hypothetical protein